MIYKSNLVLDNPKNVVVFVSDKRGDSAAYKPYLQLLAANGYTVCTFDFYTEDCQWDYESYSYNDYKTSTKITYQGTIDDLYSNRPEFDGSWLNISTWGAGMDFGDLFD